MGGTGAAHASFCSRRITTMQEEDRMTDQNKTDLDDPTMINEEERVDMEARKDAKSWQYGQSGDRVDTTIGNQGGAGAAASGPDISRQSAPEIGNSSDEPAQ
jgi:hypothetical protein